MRFKHISVVHPGMHFVGGAERLMADLALGLADEETTVDLVTGVCHEFWRSQFSQKQGKVLVRELGRPVSGDLKFWMHVRGISKSLAKLMNPETEVVITSNFPSPLVAQAFVEEHKAHVVHYIHDAPNVLHDKEGRSVLPWKIRAFYGFVSKLYAKYDAQAIRSGDQILSSSQLSRRANAKAYGIDESKIQVVYPGVNTNDFAPSATVPSLIKEYVEQTVPVIFVPKGAQVWRRPMVCLQAFKQLKTSDFVAVFSGGAPYEATGLLKRAEQLGLKEKVLWVQELPHSEINGLYKHSTAVISIAKRQGFGLIPLEALLCGSASIVSYSSGVSEVLHDGEEAMLVHDDNPQEVATALDSLLLDPRLRQRIVFNGKRKVLKNFTAERYVKEIKEKLQTA
jgi:glycosyltransferase involved in cell wall biosynthesis